MISRLLSRVSRGALLLLLLPVVAHAHPGHSESSGFGGGFSHPFSGVDHLLAIVAVTLWAAQLGGRFRWIVPGSFLAALGLGAALASSGHPLPFAGTAILLSLLAAGICLSGIVRVPLALAAAAAAAFALFHGSAHGVAAAAAGSPVAHNLGVLCATALLQAATLVLGRWALTYSNVVLRFCGGTLALGAVGLLLS